MKQNIYEFIGTTACGQTVHFVCIVPTINVSNSTSAGQYINGLPEVRTVDGRPVFEREGQWFIGYGNETDPTPCTVHGLSERIATLKN